MEGCLGNGSSGFQITSLIKGHKGTSNDFYIAPGFNTRGSVEGHTDSREYATGLLISRRRGLGLWFDMPSLLKIFHPENISLKN